MTPNEKQLLIQDISARLPYSVYIGDEYGNKWKLVGIETDENTVMFKQQSNENLGITPIGGIKPYLRPLSSMTKEEKLEFNNLGCGVLECSPQFELEEYVEVIDWLNKKHFDYRGLIEKGLALEVQ